MMNEGCPNCGQLTNASCSRLIEDTCGHKKCRICLLYEEQGCKTCEKERLIPAIIGKETLLKIPDLIIIITINVFFVFRYCWKIFSKNKNGFIC